ncbi:NADP-dependent aldehyde dehydrogenase [Sediminitomix flava]|uniref:NADP-dependent aldehyde dehydrogenase n=2 Tax=Sediminitomix flava TaxID=379075 RepID=A0A315ZDY7_SEDFL|nr:NADP-dependent aldehyde dehydrogenase [Sediminitomix flava]
MLQDTPITTTALKVSPSSEAEMIQAVKDAQEAFGILKEKTKEEIAEFLDTIAYEILALGDDLIAVAMEESNLPSARLTAERGRTMNQLKMFASVVREGSWVDAVIDLPDPNRSPLPKPDLRKMSRPIGPVVVFGASNFPLAFSTAGGDTASALASGNPVIVKAHEGHLKTDQLVSKAIERAIEKCDFPKGTFTSLVGKDFSLAQSLIMQDEVKAVAFTGSYFGGKAIYDMVQKRTEPIPVFAEMGSTNPVLLLPKELEINAQSWAEKLAQSINLGAGQFCTNPGLILAVQTPVVEQFLESLEAEFKKNIPNTMLNEKISKHYTKGREALLSNEEVELITDSDQSATELQGQPSLAKVDGKSFVNNKALKEEVFGPLSLIVLCENEEELKEVINSLEGQLTATIIGTEEDIKINTDAIILLESRVGRLIFNGVPTGVEVGYAMQHGGPFPSTTDSRFTSVGMDALKRFVRPVCYQDSPEAFLPKALQLSNPLNIWQKVDGKLKKN